MAGKNWNPRSMGKLEQWIEDRLKKAIDGVRISADFDGTDGEWELHRENTPWSEMNWDGVVWDAGEIQALLTLAEEFGLSLSPGLVERARMYQVQI